MFNTFIPPVPDDATGGIPSIQDWSAYNIVYDWTGDTTNTVAGAYRTFATLTGPGWLVFLQAISATVGFAPQIRLTVDGVQYIFGGSSGGANTRQPNVLMSPIYVRENLVIEVLNSDGAVTTALGCDYTFLQRFSLPRTTNRSVLDASQRLLSSNTTTSTTPTNIVNISGSGYITDLEFSGFGTANDSVVVNMFVDGVQKITNRSVFATGVASTKIHHFSGPIRFNTSLQVQHHVASGAGPSAVSKVIYTLD